MQLESVVSRSYQCGLSARLITQTDMAAFACKEVRVTKHTTSGGIIASVVAYSQHLAAMRDSCAARRCKYSPGLYHSRHDPPIEHHNEPQNRPDMCRHWWRTPASPSRGHSDHAGTDCRCLSRGSEGGSLRRSHPRAQSGNRRKLG